jgi:hypothetical protein
MTETFEDSKGLIRSLQSEAYNQKPTLRSLQSEAYTQKPTIRSLHSEAYNRRRTDNVMTKRKNNELESIIQKTKDLATRTPLKIRGELRCSGRVSSSCEIKHLDHTRCSDIHHKDL